MRLLHLISVFSCVQAASDSYRAVVVEYSPELDPSVDAQTNILNNVRRYVDFIHSANSEEVMPDIIVFPEIGLRGLINQEQFVEVPDPADRVRPCATDTIYQAPLVQLSCVARETATYIVVNLSEKFYNSSLGRDQYFNTDVVFDLYGVVIARYRKIHLYSEGTKEAPITKELVYFDTEFGVRFGLIICFDIIFKDPGLLLAEKYNISHFIFTTAWFSEIPFLSAIQEQWYWSYTQDAVLLAAGYNLPAVGSTGSGIYLGRQGPLVYNMTDTRGSFMLAATVPTNKLAGGENVWTSNATSSLLIKNETNNYDQLGLSEKLKLKRDFLEVYTTEPISPTESDQIHYNGSDITIPVSIEKTLCNNNLCCTFSIKVTSIFSKQRHNISRGDDYSQLFYRLAVFDGVRNYDGADTGGVQTCAILSCVNDSVSSCGVRSDDPSVRPNTMYDLFQTGFIFQSITISAVFDNSDSFIGPNVLLRGEGLDYGSLMASDSFVFNETVLTDMSVLKSFQTLRPVTDLVVASLYGRIFSRDGQPYTGCLKQTSSAVVDFYINILLLLISIVLFKYSLW